MSMTSPSTVRWLSADEQSVWRAFLGMKTQLDAQLGRELADGSGLSMADFSVLVPLSEHPESRMRILELARGLQWEKSRLSHQLTRMQQRGLIERSNCSEDRRGSFVVLTADGRAAVEAAAPRHVESVRRYVFDLLSPEQVVALGDIARTVHDRIAEQCVGRDRPARRPRKPAAETAVPDAVLWMPEGLRKRASRPVRTHNRGGKTEA